MVIRAFYAAAIALGMAVAIGTSFGAATAFGQTPQFNIVKPSTTGVPGEEVRIMRFDPSGNLWIATRWPFWYESAVAMLSVDQLPYEPLPGGGFDTGAWRVWSNVHHPIPSAYLYDMEFSADGTMWLASEGGLTRFRRNAATPQEMWHTFTPSNSPLIIPDISSIAIDAQGNIWVTNANVNQTRGLFKYNPSTNQWAQITIQPPGGTVYTPKSVTTGNNGRILVGLWSHSGFAEFDGTSWAVRIITQGGMDIGGLLQDAQGNTWIATGGSGLFKWNGTSFQSWPTVGGTFTITGLGTDRNGVVYVSTWYGGVYKMMNDNPVFFVDADNIPRGVIGRPNGEIWINNYGGNGTLGTVRHYTENGQLLERFNNYNAGLGDYFVDRIKSDSLGNLWFASGEAGLSRMLGNDGASTSATHWRNWGNHNDLAEPYPWAGNEPMYSVFEDTDGIYWMGGNGIGRWNSNTGQFTNFWNWQNSTLGTDGVKAIVKRNGTIWAGTGGAGVYWLNSATGQWVNVPLHTGTYSYSANNVKGMAVDPQGNLWVASEFGLRKFAPGNNSTFTLYSAANTALPNAGIYDVEADPTGGLWLATGAGLVRYDGTNWILYNQANTGMPGTYVYDVARRASDGLIAIASNQIGTTPYTGGVSTFNGQTWTHYTTQNSPLTHLQVMAVEFDKEGDLWASPMSEGVVEIKIGNGGIRAPFDFDGDGRTDISVFRPSDASWWLTRSGNNTTAAFNFGSATDRIVPADFTGDGKTDVAVFRPSSGEWFVLRSENNSFYSVPFGASGDVPHPADYDGDGRADLAVFRPAAGTWYIAGSSGNTTIQQFGQNGDLPVAADYDGDRRADIAIYRPGVGEWWIQRSTAGTTAFQFGTSSDKVVAGDYTGDAKADVALWRPSTGEWFILRSEDGSYYAAPFGTAGDIPSAGDYDGDGKFDVAVFRPSGGTWYVARTTAGTLIRQFGSSGDQPAPSAFVR